MIHAAPQRAAIRKTAHVLPAISQDRDCAGAASLDLTRDTARPAGDWQSRIPSALAASVAPVASDTKPTHASQNASVIRCFIVAM